MSKKLICDYHKNIKKVADKIRDIKERDYETVEDLLSDVKWYVDEIYNDANEALDAGQSMENRLSEYRNAIEKLGFTRDK